MLFHNLKRFSFGAVCFSAAVVAAPVIFNLVLAPDPITTSRMSPQTSENPPKSPQEQKQWRLFDVSEAHISAEVWNSWGKNKGF